MTTSTSVCGQTDHSWIGLNLKRLVNSHASPAQLSRTSWQSSEMPQVDLLEKMVFGSMSEQIIAATFIGLTALHWQVGFCRTMHYNAKRGLAIAVSIC